MFDRRVNIFRANKSGSHWRCAEVFWLGERRTLHFSTARVSYGPTASSISKAIESGDSGVLQGALTGCEGIREQWFEDLNRDEAKDKVESWLKKCQREGLTLSLRWRD